MTVQSVQRQVQSIKRLIKNRYPDAIFHEVSSADQEPRTLWLDVYTDQATLSDISDLVIQKQIELIVRNKYLISVVPQPLKYLPRSLVKPTRAPTNGLQRKRRASPTFARERRSAYRAKKKMSRAKA